MFLHSRITQCYTIHIVLNLFLQVLDHINRMIETIKSKKSSTVGEINTISEGMEIIKTKLDNIKANIIDVCEVMNNIFQSI